MIARAKKTVWGVVALSLLATGLTAKVTLPAIFGDHMVLQCEVPLPVWGTADPGERVRVQIGQNQAESVANAEGQWRVTLAPIAAADQPVELQVFASNQIVIRDVLVGEVWLCSGQSNMSMGVGAMDDASAIAETANRPTMRLFSVSRQVGFTPLADCQGEWVVCTPESILKVGGWKGFSAVAYQFGAELQDRLQRPVGLIASSAGGTNIHTWSRLEALQQLPKNLRSNSTAVHRFEQAHQALPAAMKEYDEVLLPAWEAERRDQQRPLDQWRQDAARAREQGTAIPPRPTLAKISKYPLAPDQNFTLPTVLFNGMIAPLAPYGLRGVIWYQGEADAYPNKVDEYGTLFQSLITDWRQYWERPALPFLFVQLPNFERAQDAWADLRNAQRGALALPATAMAVAVDAGDPADLHPADKTVIAHRLALAAWKVAYGKNIVHSGPLFTTMQVEGPRMHLNFEYADGGLLIGGAPEPWQKPLQGKPAEQLQGFEVAGADGVFQPAHAKIVQDSVQVWSDAVPVPESVRYAWAPNPQPFANLYNRAGLPASPFEAKLER